MQKSIRTTTKRTVSFSKNAINVFFHILTACNLRCRHCYINRKQHGDNTLSIDTIETWLKAFTRKSKKTNIIFLGGEPTLHRELPQAIKSARSMGYKSITIDTNGYLFHNILDKVETNEVDFISFSLDGATAKTNDFLRGGGSYDACTTGIQKANDKGFNTSLIYTVSSANIHELHMMPELIRKLGVDRFFIQVIGIRGNSAAEDDHIQQISMENWVNTIPEVAREVAESGITVTYPKVFLEADEIFECAACVAENYFIFPNGRVYQCPLCEDFPLHGMIFENNQLVETERINEKDLFQLNIPEGCVMNKLIQPGNLSYHQDGTPQYRIACCLLKEEISPDP
jgi:MoaA/NifB/PqqE/SkfB family radical SAM enzyme